MNGSGPPSGPSKAVVFCTIDCSSNSLTSLLRLETNSEGVTSSWLSIGVSRLCFPFVPSSIGGEEVGAFNFLSPKRSAVPKVPDTTVILFWVSVPVLSEQMVVAFPIVSQDRSKRTRLLSFNMRVVAKASASVTARGRPSGTATTTTVIATIKISKKF